MGWWDPAVQNILMMLSTGFYTSFIYDPNGDNSVKIQIGATGV
jgi:hypothetical protein